MIDPHAQLDYEERHPAIRTGDTVLHLPSGEHWLVAWADERELIPCGWPETSARTRDCRLLTACTEEEYWALTERIAALPHPQGGRRQRLCWQALEQRNEVECARLQYR